MKMSANGWRKLTQGEGCILLSDDDVELEASAKLREGWHSRAWNAHDWRWPYRQQRQAWNARYMRSFATAVRFESAVNNLVKVDLNQNQFDALVSFVYNVGVEIFRTSTLLKKLNKGQHNAVPSELMKWTKSKGKQMAGLVNRRSQEAALWGKGSFVASNFVEAQPAAPDITDPPADGAFQR